MPPSIQSVMESLDRANRVRFSNSEAFRAIEHMSREDGVARVREILDCPSDYEGCMRVRRLIHSVSRVGPKKVERILLYARVPNGDMFVRDLTDGQKSRLSIAIDMKTVRVSPPEKTLLHPRVIRSVAKALEEEGMSHDDAKRAARIAMEAAYSNVTHITLEPGTC